MSAASMKDRLDTAEVVDIWPDPTPLPNGLPPVKPFSYALLPEPLRPWVKDIAERMQAPAEFVAVTAIVAAGAVIGRKVWSGSLRCSEHRGGPLGFSGPSGNVVTSAPSLRQACFWIICYQYEPLASQDGADGTRLERH